MAVLRMLIEENNFNNTGVTYTDYLNFVIPFWRVSLHWTVHRKSMLSLQGMCLIR